jgi:hypothetical protein
MFGANGSGSFLTRGRGNVVTHFLTAMLSAGLALLLLLLFFGQDRAVPAPCPAATRCPLPPPPPLRSARAELRPTCWR